MRLRITSTLICTAALFALATYSANAQQSPRDHDPNAMDTTTTEPTSPAPTMTPEQIALLDRYLTNIHAQVAGKIDTRNAAAGQGVTLEVTEDARLANGTELTKGSKLIGKILRAQAWKKDASAAVLSVSIDHAVLKDGKSVPVRCVIRTVTPAASLNSNLSDPSQQRRRGRSSTGGGSMGGGGGLSPITDPMGGIGTESPVIGADSSGMGDIGGGMSGGNSPLGGSNSPGGSSRNGTGYPGTASTRNGSITRGGTANPIGTGDPGLSGSSTTVGDRTRDALGTTTSVASPNPDRPVTQAGVDISEAPRRTGLPGVMLSGASVAGVSGTLSAFENNITLDSSTQLTLGVISQ